MKLAVATATSLTDVDPDHEALTQGLRKAGIDFEWMAWDDKNANFAAAHMTVLRSTWNYVHHRDAFLAWADGLGMRLVNPPVVVRWNTHKRYLKELAEAGLPTIDTLVIPKGSGADLAALMKAKKWFKAIMKPAIGASSHNASMAEEQRFAELLQHNDMLLQPYMPEVETSGERAIIVIEGQATHAVRKSRRLAGDPENTTGADIAEDEAQLARAAMSWVERALPCGKLLYGRVDMVRDETGRPRIMELELVEPSLYFEFGPAALDTYIEGLKWRMATLSVGGIRRP